jgi:dipeptidyl aminopeptidase/acylaminoacyl peptidase
MPPVLTFHGTADGAVGIDQSRRFVARAHEVGAPVELREIDGADHGFVTIEIEPILDQAIEFLGEHLRSDADN